MAGEYAELVAMYTADTMARLRRERPQVSWTSGDRWGPGPEEKARHEAMLQAAAKLEAEYKAALVIQARQGDTRAQA